ncbi:hypothetical protein [Pelobacter seleniigenes]|uniref:hypothetical protein n=1 Tax=Pelobacter seleniigenes TaxID=407188 RepID=UPI0004A6CFEE|nr:hypothetical protein [Pelobacter seleniigenes]
MKTTKAKRHFIVFTTIFALLAISTASLACGYYDRDGRGTGRAAGYGATNSQTQLTAEQQQKVAAVKAKYADQLQQLQTAIDQKSTEYQTARANDSTTVGDLKQLEAAIGNLEQQYRDLLDKANSESGGLLAQGNTGWYNCAFNGDDDHHMGWMEHGHDRGHMGRGYMMNDDDSYCWRD